ncbi:MAG: RluA family pseudouridine synthase [Myxococcota bacterium]|nr:RluA family pseudouridine synthase [Myxococcota bacterium]
MRPKRRPMIGFKPPNMRHVPLPIVAKGDDYVVVNKPPDLLSVPGKNPDLSDCVANRVRQAFPEATGPLIAHRLDMATSGLLVLGLTPAAQRHLSMQFEARQVFKRYEAVVEGLLEEETGLIELPLRLDFYQRPLQIYDPIHGKRSETKWELIKHQEDATHLNLFPITGRTHQLRVHMAHRLGLNAPILGDRLYGDQQKAKRLMLHAAEIHFHEPSTEQRVEFKVAPSFITPTTPP